MTDPVPGPPPGPSPAATVVPASRLTPRRAGLLIALAVLAISTSAVLATWLLEDPPQPDRALSLALWRTGGGAVVLGLVAARSRRVRLERRQQGLLAGSGALMGIHFALFLGSLAFTNVASSTTLATMSPIFVAMGAAWLLREPPSRQTLVGMAITLVAAAGLGASDVLAAVAPRALLGDLLALASSVAIAGSLLIARSQRAGIPAAQYSAVVFGAAAATLAIVVAGFGAPWVPWRGTEWLAVAGMVLGPQLLGHFLLQTVLSAVPPTIVSTAVLGEPILASLLAWWLLGQVPPLGLLAAGPLVLVGVAIAATGVSRRRVLATAPTRTGDA